MRRVEVIGTVATVTNPDADQDYSLDFVGTNSVRWYQFENMERKSYYVSGSFYIPYYINPIVGETNSKRPAVALVDDRWVLLYQGADGIYFSQTQDSSITSSWAYPKKLIANGSYDMLESPSICTDGTDTYIALTGIRDSTSELIVVPYTLSATSISISTSSILKITDISAGNPRNPSLIYDGKWKLYYQTTSNNVNSMHLAVAIGGAPNSFTQKNTLEKLVDGTVVKLKSGYAALFKTYDTSGQSMTEWAYSEDGVDFTRRSTLLDRIFLENQKYYSTGDAVIAIDGDGIIHGVFSESWKDKEDDSFLTLFLPQRKAVLSYQFMFLNNSMALSSSVQAVAGERDYTVTDRVTVYESPNSEPKYEKRRAISQSSSIFLRNMEDPGKLPTKAFAIDTSADDGLAIINPLEAVASDYLFEATSGEMVIDYLNVTGWQTNAPFTTDQPARSLTVKLSGNEQIDVIKFTMNNNGYSFPKDFYFEYSNNGSDWTIMPGMVFVNYPVVTGTEVVFNCPSPVKATYVRLIATRYETAQTNTACLQISKIYFLGKTVAQENQYIEKVAGEAETWDYKGETLSKVDIVSATASSELVGWDVSQIIDGKYDNAWSSQADTAGNKDEWVALDLGSTYSVARVELFPRSDNALFPINYKIQYSMDGSTWSDAPGGAVTGNPTPRTGYRNYVTFTSPVRAKYIRLYITKKTN